MPSTVDPMPNDARHQALYRLVGRFITNWSHVEWLLVIIFGRLTGMDLDRCRIVLASFVNFRAKRDLIDRLGQSYLPESELDNFAGLIAKIKHLSEKRNLLAHRRAYYLQKGTFRFMNDEDPTQPKVWGHYMDVQLSTIRVWCKEMAELQSEMFNFPIKLMQMQLLSQPRLAPEPIEDRASSDDPHPNGVEEPPPPPRS